MPLPSSSLLPRKPTSDRVVDLRALASDPSASASASASSSATRPVSHSVSRPVGSVPVDSDAPMLRQRTPMSKRKKNIFLFSAITCVLVLIAVIVIIVILRQPAFTGERVTLTFDTPREVVSGGDVDMTVHVRNGEAVPVEHVVLELAYPLELSEVVADPVQSGMNGDRGASWQLENLAAGAETSVHVHGRLSGTPGSGIQFNGAAHYTPHGASTIYTAERSATIPLSSARLSVTTSLPSSVTSGGELTYHVRVANQESFALANVIVHVDAPSAFQRTKASPAFVGEATEWTVSQLAPGAAEAFELTGKVQGEPDQELTFAVSAGFKDASGTYAEQEHKQDAVHIVQVGARLDLTMNGGKPVSVHPGDDVSFELVYQNEGSQPIYHATIEIPFTGALVALDATSLSAERGEVVNGNRVRFTSDTLSDLARIDPAKGGRLVFTVHIADLIKTKKGEKNLELQLTPTLTGRTDAVAGEAVEVQGSALAFRVATVPLMEVGTYYYDDEGKTIGSGPLPPVAGTKTSFVVRTLLSNTTNAVEGVKVIYKLPSRLSVTDLGDPSAGKLTKQKNGTVVWDLGRLPEEVGTALPQLEASFTVEILPATSEIGKTLPLLTSAILSGHDAFADLDVQLSAGPLASDMPNDMKGKGHGVVVAPKEGE